MNCILSAVDIDLEAIGKRARLARERRGKSGNEVDIDAEVGRGTVSRLESGRSRDIALHVVARVANALQIRLDWLVFGRGEMNVGNDRPGPPDPKIGTFLLKLGRLPGLQAWIDENPSAFPLSTIARGVDVYEKRPNRSRDDGEPLGGWGAYFAEIHSGDAIPLENSAEKATQLVKKQLGRRPTVRK